MTKRSGTEQTMYEIKKELKPFADAFHDLDKAYQEAQRSKRLKQQYQEDKYAKWERRINWLTDKINKHKHKNDIVYKELEEEQKQEVDEGYYDSDNFEEEELEEDDYYNEDED